MKRSSFSRSLLYFFSLLLDWRQSSAAHADWTRSHKRYYHHDLILDEGKHSDQFFSFVTRPDLDAPKWDITIYKEDALTEGYWFVGPYANAIQERPDMPWNAPHIYDGHGDLIWSGAPVFSGYTTFDFRMINVQGKPMLSVISQHKGQAVIFNDNYEIHKIIYLGQNMLHENEIGLNIHEFTTVENGTRALYLTREPRRASSELSAAVKFDGNCYAVWDGIRELDTKTWKTTWEWTSEGRIGLDESVIAPVCDGPQPWDFFHSNSIDKFPSGDFLVSGRRTYTVYRVSRKTGEILWRLNGKKSDFEMGNLKFGGQHAVKIISTNDTHTVLSVFDNAYGPAVPTKTHDNSRGIIVELDTVAMTAKDLVRFSHPERGFANERGNMQMLEGGNAWLCWVNNALQSEHAPDGTLLMKARFRAGISSYRTFKHKWVGRPQYPPDIHSQIVEKDGLWYTVVHMSWNGATDVREWEVYHTNEDASMDKLMVVIPRVGFETAAWTEGYGTHVFVRALDRDGDVLGTSNTFDSLPPRNRSQTGLKFAEHAGEATNTEDESEGAGESWIWALVDDSRAALVFGIAIGVVMSLSIYGWRSRGLRWLPQRGSILNWWRQKSQAYEPVGRALEEEEVELGPYDSEPDYDDDTSEAKSKSHGSPG